MAVSRLLLTFALVAICIGLSLGRPGRGKGGKGGHRGGHPEKHRPNKLKQFTCKLEEDGVALFDKKCGCGNETDPGVTCSLGPLTVTKDDQTHVVTFCNISPDWPKENPWRGVLGAACKISVGEENLKEDSCGTNDDGTDIICSLGPLSVTFNDTISAQVFFCQRPERDEEESEESGAEGGEDEPEEPDEPEEEQKQNCVPLNRKPKGHKGHKRGKSGSTDNSEPGEGPEAVAVEGGADDGQTGGDGRQRPEGQGRRDQDRRPGNPDGQESDRQGEGRGKGKSGRRRA